MVYILGGDRKMLMITLNNKCQYDIFIDYLFATCKYGSFHLPNFETSMNKPSFSSRREFINKSDLDYKDYVYHCKGVIDLINRDIISTSVERNYCESTYGFYTIVYTFRLNNAFKDFLKAKDSLFDWDRDNNLPEDLSFYKVNKKCFVSVTSHDERIALYEETDSDIKYLKSVGISFSKVPKQLIKDIETPFI